MPRTPPRFRLTPPRSAPRCQPPRRPCPAPPCPGAAPRCAPLRFVPPVGCPGFGFDRCLWYFPVMLCMTMVWKGTNKRRTIGQEPRRRALLVPLINCSPTGRQPLVVFPDPVLKGFPVFVPPETCPGLLSTVPWGARWTVFSWAHRPAAVLGASTCRHPTPHRPAAPHPRRLPRSCARPPVVYPGFGFDKFGRKPERSCCTARITLRL